LEQRALLAQITFDATDSQVYIAGTADADQVQIWRDNDNLQVQLQNLAGVENQAFALSSVASIKFLGGDGDDSFFNSSSITSLAYGGTGNDTLSGGSGNDRFFGNIGDDNLYGNGGDDELRGEDDNDIIMGGSGADLLLGSNGNDRLYGGRDNDDLYGDGGDDELRGESGDDRLFGSGGVDLLLGGWGNDRLWGGVDQDTLSGAQGDDELRGEDGNDTLLGGDNVDLLIGSTGDDRLVGGSDNDDLYGDGGNDELCGDSGDDRLFGSGGGDLLIGGTGNDTAFGGADNDTIYGDDGIDELRGEDGDDSLLGGDGDDLLIGSFGEDRLVGGADNDLLFGDDGSDVLRGEDGHDTLKGGTGVDLMLGGGGDDLLIAGADDDKMYGNDGDDELRGEDGNDFMVGGSGIDLLLGSFGNDRLWGGDDNDTLYGDGGDDDMHGDAGDDRLFGLNGQDLISGGADNDKLYGGLGNDTLAGDDGVDELRGEDDDDLMRGGDGDDYFNGSSGNDILVGGDGNDDIEGNIGNDVLIGGGGADLLDGQWGDDVLIGGITAYDDHLAKLRAIGAAWSTSMPYADRVALIADELFEVFLKPAKTVQDDAVADSLTGGDAQDWFMQTGSTPIYVPSDVEGQTGVPGGGHQHPGQVFVDQPPELEGFALLSATDTFSDRLSNETIHSSLSHGSDSFLQQEHLALFESVRYDQTTHYAIHDGDWSDSATWHNGVVPTSGARVLIPHDIVVRIDGVIPARLATIRVDGTVTFDTAVNSELRVDTIVVGGTGAFEMGTATAPIQANVKARLLITNDGPIDRVTDPFAITRGLISHGRVSIYGSEVTSHVALAVPAAVGATALTLMNTPTGWKVGDTIVIAATTAGTEQNEVRQITAINGNIVSLNQPLSYAHVGATVQLEVHVANLTRNAVIESESEVLDRRGHVMFMHNRNVHIGYAGFYHLGRTNKSVPINDSVVNSDWTLEPGTGTNQRARYPVHFHRTGTLNDGNPSTVLGSAVVDAPGWGYVNHSGYVDMTNNVAFDVNGASFSTEVGDEIGTFSNNIAIGTTGSGQHVESRAEIQDFGHSGEGFWFQGVGVHVVGNISAGNRASAYLYFGRSLTDAGVKKEFLTANLPDPTIAGGATTIDVGAMPLFEFRDNVGYASGEGLATWYHLENAAPGITGMVENSKFWNNVTGVDLGYTRHTILRNLTVIHVPQAEQPINGLKGNAVTTDITFENLTVSGYRIGIIVPTYGNVVINGGQYSNGTDIYFRTAAGSRNTLITGFSYIPYISMIMDPALSGESVARYFENDVVTLDFGPFANKRLYFTQQGAGAVPFPSPIDGLPSQYVGLTNQQLWTQYGVALGGAVAPTGSITVPQIIGLIAP
jgi:Ca2+-binding RTX toxin-like protein